MPNPEKSESAKRIYCSFCGLHDGEVDGIVLGLGVAICRDCVDMCAEILAEKRSAKGFGEFVPTEPP
jgi:ATP-dependent Clp protease ATP-binding subunit ClpX